MALRYLFGPVSVTFGEQQLLRQRRVGECLIFDESGSADVIIGENDSWDAVQSRLPGGWVPDFVVVNLSYTMVPACLWSAPVPLVGLCGDWNLLWHWYRHCARACDLIFTDAGGVEAFAREGVVHARAATLYGCERRMLEGGGPETEAEGETRRQGDEGAAKDIDVLFVGNLHPAVQRDRLPWLGRLARLADHRRVAIHTGVFGKAYRDLLRRARIVFNRSIRGECNRRAFEAAAAGALLFQEAGNLESAEFFQDRQECVYYSDDNLEDLLEYYLDHEEERRSIAAAGRSKVASYSYEELWDAQVRLIEREWAELVKRTAERKRQGEREIRRHLFGRVWQVLNRGGGDLGLATDVASALVREPRSGGLHNALGLILAASGQGAHEVANYFARAVERDPGHILARLNWVEALALSGEKDNAAAQAERVLKLLDEQSSIAAEILDSGHYPVQFDFFRVEWERAAWQNAGDPRAVALAAARAPRRNDGRPGAASRGCAGTIRPGLHAGGARVCAGEQWPHGAGRSSFASGSQRQPLRSSSSSSTLPSTRSSR
jgi:hypothetical protein